MANISLTAREGGATTSASGSFVNLSGPTIVKININPKDISQLSRNGNDLIVTLKNGEKTTIHNYFVVDAQGHGNELVIEDEHGALWWVKDPQAGLHFEPLTDIDALLIEEAEDGINPWLFAAAGGLSAAAFALLLDDDDGHKRDVLAGDGDSDSDSDGSGSVPEQPIDDIDTTAPAITISEVTANGQALAANGFTNDTTPTISGTTEANAKVTIYDGDKVIGVVQADDQGHWSFTPQLPLDDSEYNNLSVTATDTAGNESAHVGIPPFTIDTEAPSSVSNLDVTNDQTGAAIASGDSLNDSTPTVSGKAEPGSTVTIYDGETALGHAVAGEDGGWSITLPTLGDGTYDNLTAAATDAAGNVSEAVTLPGFTVDTVGPNVTFDSISSDLDPDVPLGNGSKTNDTTPTFRGTAESGATITLYSNGVVIGTTIAVNGTWSITPTHPIPDGAHDFTVTATDAAGIVITRTIHTP